ncbi:MAG: hypothetical protein N2316_08320 [Spirochaetes bacterium]|nr:hypothetical protein [Spirochaetota bacterium]
MAITTGAVMLPKTKKHEAEIVGEFVDSEGKKWIRTSTEDLFSLKELNEILDAIEKREEGGEEIVLARIDFQTVNKEYYQRVQELEKKLAKRTELLKKLFIESKRLIDKKNRMLKDLIEYTKKLQLIIAQYNLKPEERQKLKIPIEIFQQAYSQKPTGESQLEEEVIEYTPVMEIIVDENGNEIGTYND